MVRKANAFLRRRFRRRWNRSVCRYVFWRVCAAARGVNMSFDVLVQRVRNFGSDVTFSGW